MCIYHFLVKFHGRWEGLAVTPEDVAKVNVNEMTTLREKEVIVVSVSNSQEIGYHTVAS